MDANVLCVLRPACFHVVCQSEDVRGYSIGVCRRCVAPHLIQCVDGSSHGRAHTQDGEPSSDGCDVWQHRSQKCCEPIATTNSQTVGQL
jgi:hypothetical protein